MIQNRLGLGFPILAALIVGGCAGPGVGLPWNRPDPDIASIASDSSLYFPDTSAVVETRFEPDHEVTTLVTLPAAPREAPAPSVVESTPTDTVAVVREPPPPTISVAISEAERIRLVGAYRMDSTTADSLRAALSPQVTSSQGKEKLQTAADLLVQARAAMEAQNLEAAANLAHKARLLVEELLPR